MRIGGMKFGVAAAALMLAAWGSVETGAAAEATLGSAAAATGRYFGAALDPDALDERPYRDLAANELTCVTAENAMKWGPVEPARGRFDWRQADALVAFARANGQKLRGHTLVWHSQLPSWLVNGGFSPEELKGLMVDHIAAEAGRYKGAIYAWDVVNEAFADDGQWRKSVWFDAMGPDYVAIALRAARAADPAAKLYVNDYNVESDGPKMRALFDLVAKLKREGAPIDGVGLQSHFALGVGARRPSASHWSASRPSASTSPSPNSTSECRFPPTRPPWPGKPTTMPDSRARLPRDAALRRPHHLGRERQPFLGSLVLLRLRRRASLRRGHSPETGGRRDDQGVGRAMTAGEARATASYGFRVNSSSKNGRCA